MTSRSGRERPVKIDMTFPEAIRFFAAPQIEKVKSKDSPAAESGSTKLPVPEADPTEPETVHRPSLFDFLPENQTHEDTSGDSEC